MLEASGGWAWGYSRHDHYVGYVPEEALISPVAASHIVSATSTLVFAGADIRAPVVGRLPMGARFAGGAREGDFVRAGNAFVHVLHVRPLGDHAEDSADVAARFLGAPYLWGGRTVRGIDCSGLVQLAYAMCGAQLPRDSDLQESAGDAAGGDPRRGDLAFFDRHVGIMADSERMIHATAEHMEVVTESAAAVAERIGEGPRFRRLI